jgi:hypothetical protein
MAKKDSHRRRRGGATPNANTAQTGMITSTSPKSHIHPSPPKATSDRKVYDATVLNVALGMSRTPIPSTLYNGYEVSYS